MDRRSFLFTASVTAAGLLALRHCAPKQPETQPVTPSLTPPITPRIDPNTLPQAAHFDLDPTQNATLAEAYTLDKPLVICVKPEDASHLTIETDINDKKNPSPMGRLFYDGQEILSWNSQTTCVFATTETNPSRWNCAIPLSVLAVTAHPLHKSHRYERKADYAWLESLSNGDSPALPPEEYLYPDRNDANFKKKWDAQNARRLNSFEFRQYAYSHAAESLSYLLTRENNAISQKLGISNEAYNCFVAALARVESGEGYLPGPGLSVVNRLKYHGWGQFGIPGLSTSPLLKKTENDVFVWSDHEVGGREINDWQDFLASPEAQCLAINSLVLDNFQSLETYFSKGYDKGGLLAAAHLRGAAAVAKMCNTYTPEQLNDFDKNAEGFASDANGTSILKYYQVFSGYTQNALSKTEVRDSFQR